MGKREEGREKDDRGRRDVTRRVSVSVRVDGVMEGYMRVDGVMGGYVRAGA